MAAGAVDAVRGTLSISTEELAFILRSAEAAAVVAQDAATLERLLPGLPVRCATLCMCCGLMRCACRHAGAPAARLAGGCLLR